MLQCSIWFGRVGTGPTALSPLTRSKANLLFKSTEYTTKAKDQQTQWCFPFTCFWQSTEHKLSSFTMFFMFQYVLSLKKHLKAVALKSIYVRVSFQKGTLSVHRLSNGNSHKLVFAKSLGYHSYLCSCYIHHAEENGLVNNVFAWGTAFRSQHHVQN